jgi:catalase
LINKSGERVFVKFHFDPELGVHSLTWDEGKACFSTPGQSDLYGHLLSKLPLSAATKISGQDPDFHRRDLEEAIKNGAPPKWTFSIQVIPSANENDFDFEYVSLLRHAK